MSSCFPSSLLQSLVRPASWPRSSRIVEGGQLTRTCRHTNHRRTKNQQLTRMENPDEVGSEFVGAARPRQSAPRLPLLRCAMQMHGRSNERQKCSREASLDCALPRPLLTPETPSWTIPHFCRAACNLPWIFPENLCRCTPRPLLSPETPSGMMPHLCQAACGLVLIFPETLCRCDVAVGEVNARAVCTCQPLPRSTSLGNDAHYPHRTDARFPVHTLQLCNPAAMRSSTFSTACQHVKTLTNELKDEDPQPGVRQASVLVPAMRPSTRNTEHGTRALRWSVVGWLLVNQSSCCSVVGWLLVNDAALLRCCHRTTNQQHRGAVVVGWLLCCGGGRTVRAILVWSPRCEPERRRRHTSVLCSKAGTVHPRLRAAACNNTTTQPFHEQHKHKRTLERKRKHKRKHKPQTQTQMRTPTRTPNKTQRTNGRQTLQHFRTFDKFLVA